MNVEDLCKIPEYKQLLKTRRLKYSNKKNKHHKKKKNRSKSNIKSPLRSSLAENPLIEIPNIKKSNSAEKIKTDKNEYLESDGLKDYRRWLREKRREKYNSDGPITPKYLDIKDKYLPLKPPRASSTEPIYIPVKQKIIELDSPLYYQSPPINFRTSQIITYSQIKKEKYLYYI